MITVLGPTACGKTHYATRLAAEIDGEIISADSRQLFRGMDIGTGKDLDEYTINGKQIPYHLIDILEAGELYSAFQFVSDFHTAYNDIVTRKKTPILCGGTGLYLSAILQHYDFQKDHPDFLFPKVPCEKILAIFPPRDVVRNRITQRLKARLNAGLIEEVQQLMKQGVTVERLFIYGLEYKFVTLYLLGKITKEELFEQLNIAIHQFAKRQMTWFRKMQREGVEMTIVESLS
ncbi:MAG: tRNA (adenosine(37)-N6)-dimethylallyltransferase MiaA [Bacteroidales bacterium]|nr:tRNA (adenosine(37)-N6)-dimethylallyltransferase MiaA [Bacteroidales bacterium]